MEVLKVSVNHTELKVLPSNPEITAGTCCSGRKTSPLRHEAGCKFTLLVQKKAEKQWYYLSSTQIIHEISSEMRLSLHETLPTKVKKLSEAENKFIYIFQKYRITYK